MTRIDVWVARFDEAPDGGAAGPDGGAAEAAERAGIVLLDADELARAARFVRPVDRRRFVAAHALLRRTLAHHTGVAPANLVIEARPCVRCGEAHGKPGLVGRGPEFNLTHSAGVVAVAVSSDRAVGLDVQEARDIDHRGLARRFFSPAERADIEARDDAAGQRRFHQLWARKEAVLKATGEGITAGLAEVDTREPAAGPLVVPARNELGPVMVVDVPLPASLALPPAGPAYAMAVAAPGTDWTVHAHAAP